MKTGYYAKLVRWMFRLDPEIVKDIRAHLTKEERRKVNQMSFLQGACVGLAGAAPLGIAVAFPSIWLFISMLILMIAVDVCFCVSFTLRARNFLLASAYSKQRGYDKSCKSLPRLGLEGGHGDSAPQGEGPP
jgi:hypothetical protein